MTNGTLADRKRFWLTENSEHPRQKQIVCALNSLERHTRTQLCSVPADKSALAKVLGSVNPLELPIARTTWNTIKSNCYAALEIPVGGEDRFRKPCLSLEWQLLRAPLTRRERNILAPIIRRANAEGIDPPAVNTAFFDETHVIIARRLQRVEGDTLSRSRARLWENIRVTRPELKLQKITISPSARKRSWVAWTDLPLPFRDSANAYLTNLSGDDIFSDTAPMKPVCQSTIAKKRRHLHAAADALVKSGVPIDNIQSIEVLYLPENVKLIYRNRFVKAGSLHTAYNYQMVCTLSQLARHFGAPTEVLAYIRNALKRLPRPKAQMTEANEERIAHIDDEFLRRLVQLPPVLFLQAKKIRTRTRRLQLLSAAVAILLLTYFPIRRENLTHLTLGRDVILKENFARLRVRASDTKNKKPIEFEIPPRVAMLLEEYLYCELPRLLSKATPIVFPTLQGRTRAANTMWKIITACTRSHLGIALNPHFFRHIAAHVVLTKHPGGYLTVQHLLGHSNIETTASFYVKNSSIDAGRIHTGVLERFA